MRLFVALNIPEETRTALAELIGRVKPKCPSAKWMRAEAMHVTLKFIGHTGEENLPAIRDALRKIRSQTPVDLQFRGLGFFPNEKRPRVLWCGVEASANAAVLAADIDQALAMFGVERETRAFVPHLTLARINSHELHQRGKSPAGLDEIVKAAREAATTDFGRLRTSEFHLFESKLKPSGAEYRVIETFPFVEAAR